MPLRETDQEERTRRRMREAEATALLLLLGARRRLVQGQPSPSDAARIATDLQYQTYHGIIEARRNARVMAANDMGELFPGMFGGIGLAEPLQDIERARRYSLGLQRYAGAKLGERGGIGLVDTRLETIAISENSQAFNQQRRAIANQIAERFDLVEIWDSRMDACDVCWGLNGSESFVGQGFPGGEYPGDVHPRCLCTSHFERRFLH